MEHIFEIILLWLFEAIAAAFYYLIPKALYAGEPFYWKYTGIILLSLVVGFCLWGGFGNNDYAWFMAVPLMLWLMLHPFLRWDRVKKHRKK